MSNIYSVDIYYSNKALHVDLERYPPANEASREVSNLTERKIMHTPVCCLFSTKNVENAYFDQRLECAAPKHWSK